MNPPILETNKKPASDNPFQSIQPFTNKPYTGNTRLGFVYQELCKQLFERHPDYQLLVEEAQLFRGKQTIGAIDFLLQNGAEIEHWEVAIKFYLLKDGLWYGPDSRDRLDKKLHRMLTHQLGMSDTEEFQQRFPEFSNISKKLLMQGRLYTNPFATEPVPNACLNYKIASSCLTGYWCHEHQIPLIKEPIYKLDKLDWIPGNETSREPLSPLTEYAVHCQAKSGQFWIIVPDRWPENS